MKQGEIYWAELNPALGREQNGKRPVLIVSGNAMNEHLGLVIVCPFSSSKKDYPGSVFIPKSPGNGLEKDSEILTFQIRTLSGKRLGERLGRVSKEQLKKAIFALNEVLIY